jgi:hypothetical protein
VEHTKHGSEKAQGEASGTDTRLNSIKKISLKQRVSGVRNTRILSGKNIVRRENRFGSRNEQSGDNSDGRGKRHKAAGWISRLSQIEESERIGTL